MGSYNTYTLIRELTHHEEDAPVSDYRVDESGFAVRAFAQR